MKSFTRSLVSLSLCCVLIFSFKQGISQTTVFKLSPKENAFMCPFLTPVFMRELTKAGAQDIRKDESMNIHFVVLRDSPLDSIRIYSIASEVGYQSKFFSIEKRQE